MMLEPFLKDILTVALFIVSLGAGAASVLLAVRLNQKYKPDFLSSYVYYQILIVINGVYSILGFEAGKYLTETLSSSSPWEIIINVIPFLGLPFLIAAWYMFMKTCAEIVKKNLSGKFSLIYFVLMVIFFLAYGMGVLSILRPAEGNGRNIVESLQVVLITLQLLTMAVAAYYLFLKSKSIKNRLYRKTIIRFGLLTQSIQLTTLGLFWIMDKYPLFSPFFLILYFGNGILPLRVLENYFKQYYVPGQAESFPGKEPDNFRKKYNISKREIEVVELICKGLTNRQISDTLFISLQTVKDHSHSIYKKMGVKNRVQLVNLIRNVYTTSASFKA